MEMTKFAEGGCACGAVRYRVAGTPLGNRICHCRACRSVSGAPVMAWTTVAKPDFHFIRGEPGEFSSSPPVRRTFCTACGTPLTYRHEEEAAYLDLATCTLDDPGPFLPTHHSWLDHNVAWVKFGDGLPSFAESRYGGAA